MTGSIVLSHNRSPSSRSLFDCSLELNPSRCTVCISKCFLRSQITLLYPSICVAVDHWLRSVDYWMNPFCCTSPQILYRCPCRMADRQLYSFSQVVMKIVVFVTRELINKKEKMISLWVFGISGVSWSACLCSLTNNYVYLIYLNQNTHSVQKQLTWQY